MYWWCTLCECRVTVDGEGKTEHDGHARSIVGIRGDILIDTMKRLVMDLRRTNRLEAYGK